MVSILSSNTWQVTCTVLLNHDTPAVKGNAHCWVTTEENRLRGLVRAINHFRTRGPTGKRGAEVVERGGGVPFYCRLRGLGSVVSSPSGVQGGAPAQNGFW